VRICLVSLHPRLLSGQISSLVGLARALDERGHDVRLVSAFPEAKLLDPDRANTTESAAGVLLSKMLRVPRIVRRLESAASDADVVQVNLPTPSFGLVGDLIQQLLGRPIVVGFEAHLAATSDLLGRRLLAAPGFYLPQAVINNRLLARLAAFRAARYVVSSQFQVAELMGFGVSSDRISVIPNLIDLEHLNDGPPIIEYWPSRGPVITYVGHFNHVKGVDVLVRAMPAVVAAHPTAQLVLAWSGLGPEAPVRRAIDAAGMADHVHIIGRVPVARVLRQSTVCVLPYRLTAGQAAYPDLLLEALTVGVPLVTSDLPLLRELLEPGWEAELVPPDDPDELARRIVRVLDDPRYQDRMVARQNHLLRTTYKRDHIVDLYEEAYGVPVAALYR
jgi:glycosyltransferase involved in cell wall biosynthesis